MDGSGMITRRSVLAGASGAAVLGTVGGSMLGAGPAAADPDGVPTELDRVAAAATVDAAGSGQTAPHGLLVDLMRDPLGVSLTPRLSWIVATDLPSTRQVAYQIQIATDPTRFDATLVHDSGRVDSAESVAVEHAGPPLSPASVYHWRVRTWSGHDRASAWSQPQRFATAAEGPWNAQAIWAPDGTFTLTDGRLDIDLTITAVSVGVFLRARDASNAYMIQVLAGSPGRIKPHVRKGGTFTVLKEATLPVAVPTGTPFTLSVELAGSTIRTYVDGTLVDTTTDATYAAGTIGFRNGRTETQRIHRVRFTDPVGTVLLDEDFSVDAGAFAGAKVAAGDLVTTTSQELLAKLGETRQWAAMRCEFTLPDPVADPAKAVVSAIWNVTARTPEPARQHVYRAWVNGAFAGLGPSRSVASEARYGTYEVAALLRPGVNCLAALCWANQDQRFCAQLTVGFADGTRQVIGTDQSWRTRRGGRWLPDSAGLNTSYYTAPSENVDARYEPVGWREPGFDEGSDGSAWQPAQLRTAIADLRPTPVEPITAALVEPASARQVQPGVWLIDLGREIIGGLRLTIGEDAGRNVVAGQQVEVRLGEELSGDGRVRYQLRAGNIYQEQWRLRRGEQQIEHWGYRGFRYAELITDPGVDLSGAVHGVALRMAWDDDEATFTSSSPDLDRVWQMCKYSIAATRLDVYQDTPTRERGPYEGDALINQRSEYATQRSFALARYSTAFLTARPTWPAEYRLMPVLLAWRDYLHTGDPRLLAEVYDTCVARNLDGSINAAGLVSKAPGSSSQTNADLVDWPTSNRDGYVFTDVNTVINAWQFAAYAALAKVAGVLGKASDAAIYTDRAAGLRTAINRDLLDRPAGRYRDGAGTAHTAQHATAFPVALGVAEDADLAAMAEWLVSGGNRVSVYGAQFLLDALYRCGRGDAGHALLTSRDQASWLHMIDDLGATICMEAWDPALKNNTTFSHAWATAPANVVAEHLAGVRIVEAGARLIEVAPQPGNLERFTATVPTIRGEVRVAMDRATADRSTVHPSAADQSAVDRSTADRNAADRNAADRNAADRNAADRSTGATCLFDIGIPPNCTGRIVLDLAKLGIGPADRITISSAGADPTRTVDGDRLVLTEVAPGSTRISLNKE